MAPEHEARPRADFYDHESETPIRRRRPAADWGVGEDIFDRMPSRRFSRTERRAEHHEIVIGRAPEPRRAADSWGDDDAWADEATTRGDADARADDSSRARRAELRREVESWGDEEAWAAADAIERRRAAGARGGDDVWAEEADARERAEAARRDVVAWIDEDVDSQAPEAPAVDSWMDERRLVPGESRTIVLGADGAPEPAREVEPGQPRERRTVKISGHPDRLPVPRTQRPPRTAVERIGASPDRIVAYAVALGFLLVLIAVLTTGR